MSPPAFARVAVPLPVDGLFTYSVPAGMELQVGHSVLVPFGSRQMAGTVVELAAESDVPTTKPVLRLLDAEPVLNGEQLHFLRWAADYYLAGLGEVIATALPAAYRAKSRRVYRAAPAAMEWLADAGLEEGPRTTLLREVVAHPGRSRQGLARALSAELELAEVDRALDHNLRHGLIIAVEEEVSGPRQMVTTVRLTGPVDGIPEIPGARMRGVLARLGEAGGELDLHTLIEQEGEGAREAVTRLVGRGLVIKGEREARDPVVEGEAQGAKEAPPPNAAQATALRAILAAEKGSFLLHGVTGSGKTEVYLQAAAAVLERGRQVLVLVPEIALTPQLCGRFRARFGDRVAVLHSGLGVNERLREWRRIRAGEAAVAVGARSGLFAPFHALGLIIVDEEHDDSYKQDDGVRYHARDLAVLRAHQAGCPAVLGSATPSLESWQNARDGRYHSLSLPERATPRPVPRIELVDLRGRPPDEPFAPRLLDSITEALQAGGKAIVLYNRRGYAPVLECAACGGHYTCPSCGTSLVSHREKRRLTCHYCGFFLPLPDACGTCGGALSLLGHGTERIEEALRAAFPDVGVVRMDADTTGARGSHHAILETFRRGEARLLVGTQLVAKGHDFPDVHVAAVVGVDHLLMLPDFRSAERTYALVTQLAGRAGRGDVPGRVLVQTRHPDHFVFQRLAGDHDPEAPDETAAFYTEEARIRRVLGYPPFARLVLLRFEGVDREQTQARATELGQALRRSAASQGRDLSVLGPVAAPLPRLVGRWRFQIVLRGRDPARFRRWLHEIRPMLDRGVRAGSRLIVDVDPRNLL